MDNIQNQVNSKYLHVNIKVKIKLINARQQLATTVIVYNNFLLKKIEENIF
jgi:hypothetical protein